jgi:hypothetical protein
VRNISRCNPLLVTVQGRSALICTCVRNAICYMVITYVIQMSKLYYVRLFTCCIEKQMRFRGWVAITKAKGNTSCPGDYLSKGTKTRKHHSYIIQSLAVIRSEKDLWLGFSLFHDIIKNLFFWVLLMSCGYFSGIALNMKMFKAVLSNAACRTTLWWWKAYSLFVHCKRHGTKDCDVTAHVGFSIHGASDVMRITEMIVIVT